MKNLVKQIDPNPYLSGLTLGHICIQVASSLLLLICLDIDLTKQLTTKNALIACAFLIPAHFLALGLLHLFYGHCHVWRKEGVSVGYAYDKNATEAGQQGVKGNWVTFQEKEEDDGAGTSDSDENENETTRL